MVGSPGSDDSLSSLGASTEPLPASDPPRMSSTEDGDDRADHVASSSTIVPRAAASQTSQQDQDELDHGDESSLTEQTSSDGPDSPRPGAESQGAETNGIEDDQSDLEEDNDAVQGQSASNASSAYDANERSIVDYVTNGTSADADAPMSELDNSGDEASDNESSYSEPSKPQRRRKDVTPARKRGHTRTATPMADSTVVSDAETQDMDEDAESQTLSTRAADTARGAAARRARGGRGRGGAVASRGQGRGRARGKPASLKRARSDSTETEQAEEEASINNESSTSDTPLVVTAKKRKTHNDHESKALIDEVASAATATAEMAALDALTEMAAPPTGLVPLSDDPKTMVNQLQDLQTGHEDELAELKRAGMAPADDASAAGDGIDETPTQDGIDDAATETDTIIEKPSKPLPKKRGGPRGGKKGKGKEKAVESEAKEDDGGDDVDTPAGSEPDEESDAAAVRRRGEAVDALAQIEIQFAKLRDKLYIQRMRDNERDREEIEKGSHPELLHLTNMIEIRRTRRLELARKWLGGLEETYERQRVAQEHIIWSWWSDERASLRLQMLDEANSKRRKLDREKRYLDRPKDDLTSALAPRPLPVVPLEHRRRVGVDSEPLSEPEIVWAIRHKDARANPSIAPLDDDAILSDLEGMELREPTRRPPAFQPFEPSFPAAQSMSLAGPYSDNRAGNAGLPYPPSYNGAAYGEMGVPGMAQPQQTFAPSVLGPLPPLPNGGPARQDYAHEAPRPPSNPRIGGAFGKEPRNQLRAFSTHPFPSSFAELDADRAGWKQKLGGSATAAANHSVPYGYDDARWRQGGPPQQLGESIELVPDQYGRRSLGPEKSYGSDSGSMNGAKSRFTLDDHMAVSRSPKGATSAAAAAAAKQGGATIGAHHFMAMSGYGGGGSGSTDTSRPNSQSSNQNAGRMHPHDHLPAASGAPKLTYGGPDNYPPFFASPGAQAMAQETQRSN